MILSKPDFSAKKKPTQVAASLHVPSKVPWNGPTQINTLVLTLDLYIPNIAITTIKKKPLENSVLRSNFCNLMV